MAGLDSAVLAMKDAQTKTRIADAETKASSGVRFRDIEGALSNPDVARKIRNDMIAGIMVLAGIIALVYIVFFVLI